MAFLFFSLPYVNWCFFQIYFACGEKFCLACFFLKTHHVEYSSIGNYVFSFRPNIAEGSGNFKKSSVEWSDDLKGGKPIRLSGLFNKLSYQVRKAFAVNSAKFSLSSANCALTSEEGVVSNIYFLIQTVGKAIPVVNPDNFGYAASNRNSTVAMQEQKEIFILPTIQVSNFLHSEIHVSLTDKGT